MEKKSGIFLHKIRALREEIYAKDQSNWDTRVKEIIVTKLEEAELWAIKLNKD